MIRPARAAVGARHPRDRRAIGPRMPCRIEIQFRSLGCLAPTGKLAPTGGGREVAG